MRFTTTIDVRAVFLGALLAAAGLLGLDAIVGGLEPGDLDYAWGFVVGDLAGLWTAWRCRHRADALTESPDGPVR